MAQHCLNLDSLDLRINRISKNDIAKYGNLLIRQILVQAKG